MGLKPKSELYHRYFLSSQVALLLFVGLKTMHNRFHKDISGEESAINEPAKYPAFEVLIFKAIEVPLSLISSAYSKFKNPDN